MGRGAPTLDHVETLAFPVLPGKSLSRSRSQSVKPTRKADAQSRRAKPTRKADAQSRSRGAQSRNAEASAFLDTHSTSACVGSTVPQWTRTDNAPWGVDGCIGTRPARGYLWPAQVAARRLRSRGKDLQRVCGLLACVLAWGFGAARDGRRDGGSPPHAFTEGGTCRGSRDRGPVCVPRVGGRCSDDAMESCQCLVVLARVPMASFSSVVNAVVVVVVECHSSRPGQPALANRDGAAAPARLRERGRRQVQKSGDGDMTSADPTCGEEGPGRMSRGLA
jgi:hypothetical protein